MRYRRIGETLGTPVVTERMQLWRPLGSGSMPQSLKWRDRASAMLEENLAALILQESSRLPPPTEGVFLRFPQDLDAPDPRGRFVFL